MRIYTAAIAVLTQLLYAYAAEVFRHENTVAVCGGISRVSSEDRIPNSFYMNISATRDTPVLILPKKELNNYGFEADQHESKLRNHYFCDELSVKSGKCDANQLHEFIVPEELQKNVVQVYLHEPYLYEPKSNGYFCALVPRTGVDVSVTFNEPLGTYIDADFPKTFTLFRVIGMIVLAGCLIAFSNSATHFTTNWRRACLLLFLLNIAQFNPVFQIPVYSPLLLVFISAMTVSFYLVSALHVDNFYENGLICAWSSVFSYFYFMQSNTCHSLMHSVNMQAVYGGLTGTILFMTVFRSYQENLINLYCSIALTTVFAALSTAVYWFSQYVDLSDPQFMHEFGFGLLLTIKEFLNLSVLIGSSIILALTSHLAESSKKSKAVLEIFP